jgi:hypothetical protein
MTSPMIPCPLQYNDAPQGGVVMPTILAGRNPSNTIDVNYSSAYLWLSDFTLGGSGTLFYQAGNKLGLPNWTSVISSASIAANFASPSPIGSTTPNSGVFTTIAVSGLSTLTGGVNTAPVVVAAGASPQTANGRSGQVTFSGVSIAAGMTQSFVINNTSIAAIGTVIMYTMVGAAAGAALTIESVTNVAGTSSTIAVTNGTGATTTTANITFTFLVLN